MSKQKRNNHNNCVSVTHLRSMVRQQQSDRNVGASTLLLAAHDQPLSPEEVSS